MLGKVLWGRKKKSISNERSLNDMLQASHLSNEEKFNNILKFSRQILNNKSISRTKEHPIFDYIRILGRGIQSDFIRYLLYYDCEGGAHGVPRLDWDSIAFDGTTNFIAENEELIRFYNLKKEVYCNKKINLSKDLILPWPWNRARLVNTITKIGKGRAWGNWKQDDNNHYIEVWLPMGIAWVNGGNHSIAVGIIQGGELTPEYYYDISEMYKHIRCDGKNFIRTKTNWLIKDEIIAPVTNVEFAAIFEIGRLLVERGISFADCN
ncbi:DUF6710 family protein [Clostridium sp. KNHs214]|uniref:DUF6710 family protein n=1 Tax=Clostridium sp. KNHs214 TaxID=1540257 RepID=UPI00068D2C5F|nr:DUF6710 family protein [Clostridium sp. KNHs214]